MKTIKFLTVLVQVTFTVLDHNFVVIVAIVAIDDTDNLDSLLSVLAVIVYQLEPLL